MRLNDIESELAQLDRAYLRRRRRTIDSPCGTRISVDGPNGKTELLSFCSNDYLGLANHPEVVEAMCAGARHWGAGSGAAHTVSGHLWPHQQLEEALAWFVAPFIDSPRILLFATGYMANLGITPTLVGRGDAVFSDRLNHASLIDAALAAVALGAEHKRYAHNDIKALRSLLAQSTAKHKLILTDAVFSMDGDLAPLPELLALAEEYDAWLVIDDAHGFGVLGQQGRGSLSHFALPGSKRIVYMGTLGKAAGVAGAFVAADARVIEWLQQRARTAIFTTAHPPAVSAALLKSLELIEQGDVLRQRLQANIALLRQKLAAPAAAKGWQLGSQHGASITPIQPLIVGSNQNALDLSAALEEQGIWVPAIRPPTVPQGSARLRICLSAMHRGADIDALVTALGSV